jgi:23S rRNA pseudouridine2605 synthase
MTNLAYDVKPQDVVVCDGQELKSEEKKEYYLLYKPVGYTSTTEDPHAEKIVTDLIKSDARLFPVGRLDKDSEGLIVLTNDGDFAQKLQHPSNEHEKEYIVEVAGRSEDMNAELDAALRFLTCGIKIGGYRCRPGKAKVIKKEGNLATFNIVIKEGRKRQIRETIERAKLRVVSLKRIRIANYELVDLEVGESKAFEPDKTKI